MSRIMDFGDKGSRVRGDEQTCIFGPEQYHFPSIVHMTGMMSKQDYTVGNFLRLEVMGFM
jgi:hypothetical protein